MALICSILLMALFFSMEEKRERSVKVRLVFVFLKPIDFELLRSILLNMKIR